jgi:PAS domain S-box-containing protein
MTQQHPAVEQIFAGNSEMASLMRSHDWASTSLGSVEQWSQSLKTAVRIMLTSRQPMFVWWGKELINLYNDAYRAIVGGKHPTVLGQPAAVVWREIWDQVGPRAESAMLKNEGTYDEALLLIMERNGYPEETYYTFSYSPIPDEQGVTSGIICANTDDTQRIIGERQLMLLRELAASTADARTLDEACTRSVKALQTDLYDLPFAMIYLVDPNAQHGFLAGTSGIEPDHLAAPPTIDLSSDLWALATVLRTQKAVLIPDLASRFGNLPKGAWDRPPQQAVAVPIAPSGQTGKAGVLMIGLNPLRLFDDSYQGFIDLVAGQIAASLANAQTYEAERKRAEALAELDRAKTAFFSNVSHEFRTPLTLMLSPLEDLSNSLHERLRPEEREQLQLVQRNGLRLQKLVNTLLDFSRIEAGRVQASYEPTDLAAYTADLASTFRSLIERAGMQFVIDCPPLPEPVYVDREMWEKIVLNLLSNAFKFTFDGEIKVRLHPIDDFVVLSIEDTGVGIPEAELPRLFERFHRVSGTRSRTYEGSGIGLALVQELVKLHGGTLQVTSQVEQGTKFAIALPFGLAHLPPDRIQSARTLESTALGAVTFVEEASRWLPEGEFRVPILDFGLKDSRLEDSAASPESNSRHPSKIQNPKSKILLADDNADMRDYVKRLLRQYWTVETVSNGLEALEAIAQQLPDLVLTDVMMPGLDGFGLLRQLRSDPRTREIPIILLSARAGEEARVEGLEAGADDYLTKPFSARELLARVEANLKLAQLRRTTMQQEQALRLEAETAKQQVETILSSIRDGFYVLDRDWQFTYANDRYCEMVGMQRAEILGQNVWELFPAAVDTEAYRQLHRAIAEQTSCQFEYFYAPWKRWYDHRIYPSSSGLTAFLADITDRRQAEAELRQKNAILDVVNESAPTPIFVKDRQGRIIYANPATLEVLGKSAAEVIGYRDCDVYADPEYAIAVMENDQRIMAAGQTEVVEESPDGIRTFLGMKAPYRNPAGEVIGLIGISNDISDRVQIERDREQILQREQAAREAAEQANRIKDEFLAVLSHELRSPLNPILGWAKLLRTGKLDATKTAQALATIERNAKLQSELIEDLLDVSRILQGKLSLNVSPIHLASTIKAAIETVRLAAEAKSITIETHFASDFAPEVGQVSGDSTRLQQVVWNLLSNAVKFTPSGGRVTVQLEQIDHQAQITISDTGKGIRPEFVPYIFDYFRQEDGATTRKFGGLGLGLAIVRQIVELHGGSVQATSLGEGQGATFTVQLPLMPTQSSVSLDPGLSDRSLNLGGVQILVVDDEPDSREFIAFTLEQAGASVLTATTASEAFAMLTCSPVDVLLSDIGMPDMDGYMLMRQIRGLPPAQGGQVKAIALTAYAGDFNQQQAFQAGFQQHLAKPIEPLELIQAIANLVKHTG